MTNNVHRGREIFTFLRVVLTKQTEHWRVTYKFRNACALCRRPVPDFTWIPLVCYNSYGSNHLR